MAAYESSPFPGPIAFIRVNRGTRVEPFDSESFEFFFRGFIVTSDPFQIGLNADSGGFRVGAKLGLQFGT